MKNIVKTVWLILRILILFAVYFYINHIILVTKNTDFYNSWIGDTGKMTFGPVITIMIGLLLFWKNIKSIEILGATFDLRQKLDKVMVEYEAFRNAVTLLLQLELSRIESEGRFEMGVSVETLKGFVLNNIPTIRETLEINDAESDIWFRIARAKAIELQSWELARTIIDNEPQYTKIPELKSSGFITQFIDAGLNNSDRPERITESAIKVDIEGLKDWLNENGYPWQTNKKIVDLMNEIQEYYFAAYDIENSEARKGNVIW
ncbi:hypothetical protein FM131_08915 [Weissella confusa]|uniref:hypothetical protein n=1 Tax=Weissella confusa TaxID=1583 RepID=UPI0009899F6F|nr:hypothetical protein [Weissella confusa]SJX70185.1 hypothetical protein FM131_08915 [Weissella confusa]